MPPPVPRITDVSLRYEHADRHAVTVTLTTGERYDMIMTPEQHQRIVAGIALAGSAPVPTGANA